MEHDKFKITLMRDELVSLMVATKESKIDYINQLESVEKGYPVITAEDQAEKETLIQTWNNRINEMEKLYQILLNA